VLIRSLSNRHDIGAISLTAIGIVSMQQVMGFFSDKGAYQIFSVQLS
jgi:hypothetical protein